MVGRRERASGYSAPPNWLPVDFRHLSSEPPGHAYVNVDQARRQGQRSAVAGGLEGSGGPIPPMVLIILFR